jgi:formate-dependent nitrite reductase membrane component NrfD
MPWGEKITAYMFFKAIGAGALILGGVSLLSFSPELLGPFPPVMALIGITLATLLLVADLKRPDRFLFLILKAQSKSWLVRGSFVLMAGAVLALAWGVLLATSPPSWVWMPLGLVAIVVGAAVAGYTALLFGQAKGRQLWQSPLLLPHLVVQAGVAGASALALLPGLLPVTVDGGLYEERIKTLGAVLALFLALNLVMILGELWSHAHEDARLAIRWMRTGDRATTLNFGVFGVGHIFPAAALAFAFFFPNAGMAVGLAAVASLLGVYLWDDLYVRAGQAPPLS